MKIGLVIQGPIHGGGLTGATYGNGKTSAPSHKFKQFNATDSILSNIAQPSNFDHIAISTWVNEPTDGLSRLIKANTKCEIIKSIDPTPNPDVHRKPVDGIPYLHQSNKVRMFHSTRKGLEHLKSLGVEHAIKIRTDQIINMDLLYREFLEFIYKNEKNIFIPLLRENTPWIISDFYFGGKIETLESICRFLENSSIAFHKNIHNDFFFKTYFMLHGMFEDTNWESYFINTNIDPISHSTDSIIRKSIKKIWQPGTRELYQSIIWRGEKIVHIQDDSYFQNSRSDFSFSYKVSDNKKNTNYNLLISNVFGKVNYAQLFISCISFELKLAYRKIRNLISVTRDKYGLRF